MKNKNIIESIKNAFSGIKIAVESERNIKFHILAAILAFILGFVLGFSRAELSLVLLLSALVIASEAINTAIESLVDMVCDVYHPKAKVIKDVASGAVLVTAFFAVIIAILLYIPKIMELINIVRKG